MHQTKLQSDECGTKQFHKNLNKETQTKAIIIIDSKSSIQVSKSSSTQRNTTEEGSVTLFDFCQILQDPECPKSVIIIKETVSEEVYPKNTLSEQGAANRYKYSKEVIEPYIQSYPAHSSPSKDELIKDVLKSVHQDFPDYQPCIEIQENESIANYRESSKVDAVTSFDSKPSKVKMETGEKDKNNVYTNIKQRPGCFPTDVDTPSGIPDPGCDIQPRKTTKSVESVESEKSIVSGKTPCPPNKKPPPKVCDPTCEAECAGHHHVEKKKSPTRISEGECPPSIDYCTRSKSNTGSEESIGNKAKKKTSAEVFGITKHVPPEKRSSVTMKKTPVPAKPDTEEVPKTDSQTSSISLIKTTMEDFITKICTRTNETFTQFRKGNVKDGPKSLCDDEDKKDKENSKGFSFFRKVDSQSKDEESNNSCDDIGPDVTTEDLVDNVDSAMSDISDAVYFNDLPDTKAQNFNNSLREERKPPKDIVNIIVQTNVTSNTTSVPQSSSVFATIKTKIFSLFGDEKNKDGESNSTGNCSQLDEDDDADLMERLIE